MPNRIEPPVLMSRLLTFVFASSFVVVIALIVTLANLFPLNRPQVFFLMTKQPSTRDIRLSEMVPDKDFQEVYKRAFIQEYIRARNEIVPNIGEMRLKWDNAPTSLVRSWSSDAVFADFTQTAMRNALMYDTPDFDIRCPVQFVPSAITPVRNGDTYTVTFEYACENSDGQTAKQSYTILIRLESDNKLRWVDRLSNPLGIRVAEYTVQDDMDDPLDFKFLGATRPEMEGM